MDIGFYLPAHWHDVKRHAVHMYREMLVEAREAEQLGFSSLHIPEHHFWRITEALQSFVPR